MIELVGQLARVGLTEPLQTDSFSNVVFIDGRVDPPGADRFRRFSIRLESLQRARFLALVVAGVPTLRLQPWWSVR